MIYTHYISITFGNETRNGDLLTKAHALVIAGKLAETLQCTGKDTTLEFRSNDDREITIRVQEYGK